MHSPVRLPDVARAPDRRRASCAILLALVATLASVVLVLAVDPAAAAQLTLTWTDNADGTAMFKVERKTGTTGTYAAIGSTAVGATTYVDTAVAAGTTYCYRVRASNAAGESGHSNEACGTPPSAFDVTIAKSGTGAGAVTSSPAGVTCGTDCAESFASGTIVTLTGTPASGSVFSGWSGGGCTGTGPCTVSGNTAVTITATFTVSATSPTSYSLSVAKSGTGTGRVVSSPAGINCGAYCSGVYPAGRTLTLTARPATGSTFSGWTGGGCSGTGSCTVTMNATIEVTAAFTKTTATATRYSLWSATATPRTIGYPDAQPATLGVKFRSSVNGYITAIRFYKASTSTGPHVGSLYSSTGQRLGTVTFTGETSSGWQEARFSTPVPIAANTTYVAAYHTTVGRYSVDAAYFANRAVDAGPLQAPSSAAAGGNGVYRYGSTSAFPNQTYNGNNYWVDVVFSPR